MKVKKSSSLKALKAQHKSYVFDVVGIEYRATAPFRRELAAKLPLALRVKREPHNTHDPNAVAIELADSGMKIGYLRRTVAEVLAPAFDDSSLVSVWAELVELDPDTAKAKAEIWLEHEGKLALDKIS
jgi:hypothetical protein